VQFSPVLYYLVPLRPKHLPWHPVPNYPHPIFCVQCERSGFTPIL
jgi:hypothetical protein